MFIACKYRYQAENDFPDAVKIVKVEGGFMAFHTMTDYHTWSNQK